MRLRYDTGSAFGFVRGGAIVVLPDGATSELVRALWERLDASGDAETEVIEVIQLLTVVLGATLRTMPSFAVAVVSGQRVQVAVRGDVSVTLRTPSESVHVDGDDVSTWSERSVEGVEVVSVQLGVDPVTDLEAAAGQVALVGLPLREGVVLASRIVQDLVEVPVAQGAERSTAEPTEAADAPARVPAPPSLDALAWGPPTAAPAAEPSSADAVPVGRAVLIEAPLEGDGQGDEVLGTDEALPDALVTPALVDPLGHGPGAAVDRDQVEASEETIAPEATIAPELTIAPDATVAPDVERPAAAVESPALSDGASSGVGPVPAPPTEAETGYGHLWESTVLRTVEDAAIRVDEDGQDEGASAPTASAPLVAPSPGTPAGSAPSSDDEPEDEAGMIAGIPREWTGATPAAAARAFDVDVAHEPSVAAPTPSLAAEADDHDGHTVFSSVIADLRAQVGGAGAPPLPAPIPAPEAPPAPPAGAGPTFSPPPAPGSQQILARVCREEHANPASRDTCGRCGAALDGDAHLVTRPSLGHFTLSNGQVVELDRPVVLGRRPRTTRAQSNDLPRLVAVPSPEQDISRSHVEVQLEGWHVLVCDLNTTNGTTVLRPGQPPRRLHPGEPMMVASGDVVDVGDGVTFVFEGLL
ncbi:FHA domain-containing protein [Oerskovia enterophila]|uniref:FHA domain protein n=1 Tax=Oerskovia enterophila TaxID=43678 RepID=A0ABX2YG67_9CELL|nr:FHA domain-containing protein [Oerskovia enterophila]OCI33075.1 FHA domain protein [Oerskovia enterophila]